MFYRLRYLVLFILVFLSGCRLSKIKTSCLIDVNEKNIFLKKEILYQIDSVYISTPSIVPKKMFRSRCVNDSVIEVKVLNNIFIYDLFYFDYNGHFIEIKHELEELY